jgi:hypothetical protein
MTSPVNWTNPYAPGGSLWLKGNLHLHTTFSSDGEIAPEDAVQLYRDKKYSFIAFTDHNRLSPPGHDDSTIFLLAGIEVDFAGSHHTCLIHPCRDSIVYDPALPQDELLASNYRNGNLVVLNHPDWQIEEHYSFHELLRLKDYSGIEIYNTKIETLEGSPLSTAKWDRLLSSGKKVLGFANQDAHTARECIDCCNVVRVGKKDREAIFCALRTGSFYCYYGVELSDIGREGSALFVKTRNAELIRFIGHEGRLLKEQKGRKGEIRFADDDRYRYIRIECLGRGKQISWSQPFFRD